MFKSVSHNLARITMATSLAAMPVLAAATSPVGLVQAARDEDRSRSSGCQLESAGHAIQHVIWLQFDNVHFTRDNSNVPSDLEQMPHLLSFIENNGTMLTNHHTPLIANTATDILTTLTGVYPDRHGVPVANSYRYFKPDGTSNPASSFTYWTDPLYDFSLAAGQKATDTAFNMLTDTGANAPAPWVPFTRAGCNVGAVGTANIELENTTADVPVVFGPNSPEAAEVAADQALPTAQQGQASADFVGVAVHCARGAPVCQGDHASPDRLPAEPGGYSNFQGLFGHKYVAPAISPNGPLTDLNGAVIADSAGHIGFPGFDGMVPATSLAYAAAMQEHGIPITINYVSDAHQQHVGGSQPFGPGEAGYVQQLKTYDDAFATFFERLQKDGIDQHNALFVVTADEGDHAIAGPPSPANCDGVSTPCTYSQIGEVSANLTGLLATQQHISTPFTLHADAAPAIYITGNPADNADVTRSFERALGSLTAVNPYSGRTEQLANYLADRTEMKLLHMITADPARTPTLALFAKPDYFVGSGAPNCGSPCASISPGFNWNHGDIAPEINTTFLGLVGPGVRQQGVDNRTWTDHTDTRPTVLSLVGLRDDYVPDGRVIFEILEPRALPDGLEGQRASLTRLAHVYKQLNAPLGALSMASLVAATTALSGSTPGDQQFIQVESEIQALTNRRDNLAHEMREVLSNAAFGEHDVNGDHARDLADRGDQLIGQAEDLAANP